MRAGEAYAHAGSARLVVRNGDCDLTMRGGDGGGGGLAALVHSDQDFMFVNFMMAAAVRRPAPFSHTNSFTHTHNTQSRPPVPACLPRLTWRESKAHTRRRPCCTPACVGWYRY